MIWSLSITATRNMMVIHWNNTRHCNVNRLLDIIKKVWSCTRFSEKVGSQYGCSWASLGRAEVYPTPAQLLICVQARIRPWVASPSPATQVYFLRIKQNYFARFEVVAQVVVTHMYRWQASRSPPKQYILLFFISGLGLSTIEPRPSPSIKRA